MPILNRYIVSMSVLVELREAFKEGRLLEAAENLQIPLEYYYVCARDYRYRFQYLSPAGPVSVKRMAQYYVYANGSVWKSREPLMHIPNACSSNNGTGSEGLHVVQDLPGND